MLSIKYLIIMLFILGLTSHCYLSIWKIKKHLHILQLNSYFNSRYFVWLKREKLNVFSLKDLAPLIALLGTVFRVQLITLILFVLAYLKLILSITSVKEKKPLVYTPRLKRLFYLNIIILMVLYLEMFIWWWHKGDNWLVIDLIILTLYNFCIPLFLMLFNLLLYPLEKFIQHYYFTDAKNRINAVPNLHVIGITGSYGKTTTKYIVAEILKRKFNTLVTPQSYNTTMGVTKTIRYELKPTHEIFVVEMSAKKPGDIKELCSLTQPQYGLITAIGEQHLETFKTLDAIKKTKNELIESLPKDGVAFFNLDDKNSMQLTKLAQCRVVYYGVKQGDLLSPETINPTKYDYYASNLTTTERGSSFTITRKRDNLQTNFQTKLLGISNVYNTVAAIAIASEMGIELSDMVYPIKQLAPIPHRLELKQITSNITFIDDAFNSNPIGSKIALTVLQQISGKRKIIVTPGMVELGTKEEEYNKRFGEQMADICDYIILVGKNHTKAISDGLKEKKYPENLLFIATDFNCAYEHLQSILQAGDIVLFENDLPDNYN